MRSELNNINLSNCQQLKELWFSNNWLTSLDFLHDIPHPKSLNYILFGDNVFPPSELNAFERFSNLQRLSIANNNFAGSLEPLKNLTKLKILNIKNTNICRGLEYLPGSLQFWNSIPNIRNADGIKGQKISKFKSRIFPP